MPLTHLQPPRPHATPTPSSSNTSVSGHLPVKVSHVSSPWQMMAAARQSSRNCSNGGCRQQLLDSLRGNYCSNGRWWQQLSHSLQVIIHMADVGNSCQTAFKLLFLWQMLATAVSLRWSYIVQMADGMATSVRQPSSYYWQQLSDSLQVTVHIAYDGNRCPRTFKLLFIWQMMATAVRQPSSYCSYGRCWQQLSDSRQVIVQFALDSIVNNTAYSLIACAHCLSELGQQTALGCWPTTFPQCAVFYTRCTRDMRCLLPLPDKV